MLVSIVILTYSRNKSVNTLLSQLIALGDDNLEIIVVDNGSGREISDALKESFPEVRLVVLPENKGVGSRNRGLEIAKGEVVVTLDDDMIDLTSRDIDHLRQRFSTDENIGAINFKVVWPGTDRVRDWVHRRPPSQCNDCFPTYEITEGAVAWRLVALKEVGYYREDFFISHEGVELAFRLLDSGWRIEYDGLVEVGHDHALGGRTPWRRYYYDTRNLFAVAVLHMPRWYALKYILVGAGAMLVYSIRDWHFWAWMRGMVHGLKNISGYKDERQVWTAQTRDIVNEADSWRPSFWMMVFRRLRQKNFSLE